MAIESVSGRYDGPELERRVLAFWREQEVFRKTLELSEGRPLFTFSDGPPTANGKPGIHHVLARAFKDIYPRYRTMRGFHVPRKAGWDTHGLPVEHEIEKELGIFDKKEIEARVGVEEFTRRCRESVMRYIGDWERMTERMGFWINLDDAYYTLDNDYIESVWSLLKTIWDKGLIYRGYKVVPYDPRIGATLSSHEVAQGYREVADPSVTVRFRLADDDHASFLVWTTTPWTLPSNLALAVGEDLDYVYVECAGETLILAAALRDAVLGERAHAVMKTVKGSELVGARYRRPFDYLEIEDQSKDGVCRVLGADFVSVADGTGIVHVAPAYGVDDLELGRRHGLPVLHGVGLDGCFKAEATPVAGRFFKDADPILIGILKERGDLFEAGTVTHNYPFGWRTGDPLIYYAKDAWYIRTTEVAARMTALNRTINWVPQTIRDGRFGNWLENNIDWALSRERFWGTPLPVWSDGAGHYRCIGSVAELEELCGRELRGLDLHRPAVDAITFEKDGATWTRVPEVIDCWFDSGAMSYAQWHYPFENRERFARHFPADYICEAIDQTRGWFYTLHAIATLVSDGVAFKNCVCLAHILDANGKKMSKSQGNIVDPYEVFDTIGADPLRWYFLARVAPEASKRISVDIAREVASSFVNTYWNAYAFFAMYATLDKVDLTRRVALEERAEIDRWAVALLNETVATVTEAMDRFDAHAAGGAIESFVDQLSNWYIRRNRRRFWKADAGDDKQSAYLTLYECLETVNRLVAPFMPLLSEAVYQNLTRGVDRDAPLSVHMQAWPEVDETLRDQALIEAFDVAQRVVYLGRAARESSRVRVRQPLARLMLRVPDERARAVVEAHAGQILEELNVKRIEFLDADAELLSYRVKPRLPELGRRYGALLPAVKRALARCDAAALVRAHAAGEPYTVEVEGRPLSFAAADVLVETESSAGYSCAEDGGFLAGLDTTVTEELRIEGVARELVRTVQDARKRAGLEVSDRIVLRVEGSARVAAALDRYRDHLMSETLATSWGGEDFRGDFETGKRLNEERWTIRLRKAVA